VAAFVYVSGSAVRIPAFGKSSGVMGLLLCGLRTCFCTDILVIIEQNKFWFTGVSYTGTMKASSQL
jgi:hypothetical protein